jgi:hypothetical protein
MMNGRWNKTNPIFDPIVEHCAVCDFIVVGPEPGPAHCSKCYVPAAKWKNGKCNLTSHLGLIAKVEDKKMLNPLKASKRSMGK